MQFFFEVTNPWVSDEGIGPLAEKVLMLMGTYACTHTPHRYTQHTHNTLTHRVVESSFGQGTILLYDNRVRDKIMCLK